MATWSIRVEKSTSLSKGGPASYGAVVSGGAQHDTYGATSNTTISQDSVEDVYSGGLAKYSQIYGREGVSSGGSAYSDTVDSGAS